MSEKRIPEENALYHLVAFKKIFWNWKSAEEVQALS